MSRSGAQVRILSGGTQTFTDPTCGSAARVVDYRRQLPCWSARTVGTFARLLAEVVEPYVCFTQHLDRGKPDWLPDRLPRLDAPNALAAGASVR